MENEKQLYKGCLNRSREAQEQIFHTFLPLMHGICLRYTKSASDADDMVQEGFIKFFSKIDSFSWKGKGSIRAWLQRIMVNVAIDHYNRNKKNPHVSISDMERELPSDEDYGFEFDPTDDTPIEYGAVQGITKKMLLETLSELPEDFRVVFNLFAIDGLKHKEIAELLDIETNTSITRFFRARAKLQKKLQKKIATKNLVNA